MGASDIQRYTAVQRYLSVNTGKYMLLGPVGFYMSFSLLHLDISVEDVVIKYWVLFGRAKRL